MKEHKFPYEWTLKDSVFSKDKGKVFSCFAAGGGSTLGYKLAGFDVIGCNEIDPKMNEAYIENNKPKYSFLEPIQTFKNRDDLPKELYDLDILDGSPPCSSFSMVGNREKDWGKEKKFKEGQAEQVLDDLFFDFIDLAKKLQPKVVVAENVRGLLMGAAKKYVIRIYKEFDEAGYYCQHWLLNSKDMGVPQKRQRVFFVCMRKDLAEPLLHQKDMFTQVPKLKLQFKEEPIVFGDIFEEEAEPMAKMQNCYGKYWEDRIHGDFSVSDARERGGEKRGLFSCQYAYKEKVLYTITAHTDNSGHILFDEKRYLSYGEYCKASSFPNDYDFGKVNPGYIMGMSVPPVMMANIADQIHEQWLSKI